MIILVNALEGLRLQTDSRPAPVRESRSPATPHLIIHISKLSVFLVSTRSNDRQPGYLRLLWFISSCAAESPLSFGIKVFIITLTPKLLRFFLKMICYRKFHPGFVILPSNAPCWFTRAEPFPAKFISASPAPAYILHLTLFLSNIINSIRFFIKFTNIGNKCV